MLMFPGASLADPPANANLSALVLVCVNAILEVFFLCLVGFILARKGIIDDKAKKVLNKVNVTLFTPCLLFSKVAFTLTPDKLQELSIIPVGFAIVSIFSASVAYLLGSAFRLRKGQRNFAIACSMFQNSNSLPIALMQSLIGEKMPISWGPKDTKDEMLGRALTYLVFYSTLGIIVRWSVGVKLLTSAEQDVGESPPVESDESDLDEPGLGLYSTSEGSPLLPEADGFGRPRSGAPDEAAIRSKSRNRLSVDATLRSATERATLTLSAAAVVDTPTKQHATLRSHAGRKGRPQSIFQSFPNTPMASHHPSEVGSDDERDGDDEEWGGRRGAGRREEDGPETVWGERWRSLRGRLAKVRKVVGKIATRIGDFMTVPLWAALLSLAVACTPPVQSALHDVEPLKAALRNAGNCSVPITLVTLGAYFYRPSPDPSSPSLLARMNLFRKIDSASPLVPRTPKKPPPPGETRTVMVAVVSRMVVTPLVLLPLFGWYAIATTNVADDPVFIVSACLLIGSPTAITLAQITSSASGETFEKLISRTLFVSYAVMTPACTIALVLAALHISKLD